MSQGRRLACVAIAAGMMGSFGAGAASAFTSNDITPNTWVQLTVPQPLPDPRGWNQGLFESATGSLLYYEGYIDSLQPYTIYSNSIWSYSFASNAFTLKTLSPWHGGNQPSDWYLISPCTDPCSVNHPYDRHPYGGLVFDSVDNRAILFSGVNARSGLYHFDDTWALDVANRSWTNMNPASPPPGREEHVMVYAPTVNATILFSGDQCNYKLCADVWSYSYPLNQWTRLDYPGQVIPPPRRTHSMVFDESTGHVVLFGGDADSAYVNDTWTLDPVGNQWTHVFPAVSPAPRVNAGFAYDTRNHVSLLFGGTIGTYASGSPVNDTWLYSDALHRWTQLNPPSSPPALGQPSWHLTYEKNAGVFLLNDGSGHMWAFRYVPAGADTVAPAPITDLRAR